VQRGEQVSAALAVLVEQLAQRALIQGPQIVQVCVAQQKRGQLRVAVAGQMATAERALAEPKRLGGLEPRPPRRRRS